MSNEQLNVIDKQKTPLLAANRWGKIHHVDLVNEGINLVYCYEQGAEKYYLRLTHAKLRSKDETAPGGNDKKQWLRNIYQKIVQLDWVNKLSF